MIDRLGREDKLKEAKGLDKPAIQYRTEEVYHLFQDAKVVAPGAAERSYDPINESMNLMAPYIEEGQWSWLIQASKKPDIITNMEHLQEQEPLQIHDNIVWIDDWMEDGYYVIEAMLRHDEQFLYFHDICADEKEVPYLKECIYKSGFQN